MNLVQRIAQKLYNPNPSNRFERFGAPLLARLATLEDTPESEMLRFQLEGLRREASDGGYTLYFVKEVRAVLERLNAQPIALTGTKAERTEDGDTVQAGQAQSWIFDLFGHLLVDVFKAQNAPNYIECGFVHTDLGPITLHMQKQAGKTPHQLRLEAEAERDELKRAAHQYLALYDYAKGADAPGVLESDLARETLQRLAVLSGYEGLPCPATEEELEKTVGCSSETQE